jgi:predicted hydrocarbon binding protein
MGDSSRKYAFSWDLLGVNLNEARPRMGDSLNMEIYRLFQFTMRDVLEARYGSAEVDKIFFESGVLAGTFFFERYLQGISSVAELVKTIQDKFRELGVGIFRVETSAADASSFTLVVDEDLDCSGLPDTSDHICIYDEGFIKGILDAFTASSYEVNEIDCWCSGARTCRFFAKKVG